jgi:hypothetical protein
MPCGQFLWVKRSPRNRQIETDDFSTNSRGDIEAMVDNAPQIGPPVEYPFFLIGDRWVASVARGFRYSAAALYFANALCSRHRPWCRQGGSGEAHLCASVVG